jgi:hypothetical protein
MENDILKRPSGKYWMTEDIQALDDAKKHSDLVIIALEILNRMPEPIVQICGPLTTGGLGSFELNVVEFEKAIIFFSDKREKVFDQLPFQNAMKRLSKGNGYNKILTNFYLPIFKSGKIETYKFLPGWQESRGAKWEHKTLKKLKCEIIYLPKDWDR